MNNYNPFIKDADSYFGIVSKNMLTDKKLGNKVLFSISSMVIEKYLVALLLIRGIMASGHTISGLIQNVKNYFPELPSEIKNLQKVDNQLDLCSFNAVSSPELNDDEMEKLFSNLQILRNFVYQYASETVENS